MNEDILNQINELPPLPQTVLHIDEFKRKADKSPPELAAIIGKDPLILSTLLKVSNSAMFGFKKRIETPQMAVSLLGVNFTISLALGSAIKNLVETSLEPLWHKFRSFFRDGFSSSCDGNKVVKCD